MDARVRRARQLGQGAPPARPRPAGRSLKDSTAIREATSPACAPPMPSATTNSGARASSESSLARRWRPVSVPAYCSATRSTSVDLEREFAVADAHAIARMQRPRRLAAAPRSGRCRWSSRDPRSRRCCPARRCARGARGERVLQADLGAIAATEHEVAVEVVDHPRLVARRALDDQPRRAVGASRAADRRRRVQAGRVTGIAAPPAPRSPASVRSPPRRSRRALRATHSRNRYMTARKPNFSATDTGARASSSNFEDDLRRAELDAVAGSQRLRRRARPSVDAHAVGRAEVRDRPAVVAGPDLRVAARDPGVVEHDVAVAAAPDRRRRAAARSRRRPPTASSARAPALLACASSTWSTHAR